MNDLLFMAIYILFTLLVIFEKVRKNIIKIFQVF